MRRTLVGLMAFLAMTGLLLVLPVYAAPVPDAHPVEASIDEVALGSVVEPSDEAVVLTDGTPQPDGVDEPAAPAEETPAEDVVSSGAELPGVPALTVSQPDTEKFSTVGVTWRQSDVHDVVVQLRVKNRSGDWGEWTTLAADDVEQSPSTGSGDEEVRGGTAPYWTDDAYGVEVIVQGEGGAVPQDVKVALVDPGTSAADKLPVESGAPDQAGAAATMPEIISRAQWGADESIRTWDPEYAPTIKAATLHHTADRNTYTAAEVPGMMRSIFAYHTQTRGWGDIGYNVIVDKFGRIFEGRYGGLSSTVIGAHAGGFNTGTFGVSMLGNYAEVDTPQVVLDSVAAVTAWKLSLYGVSPYATTQLTSGGGGTAKYDAGQVVTLPTVFAHRDVGNTTCPGDYAYSRMAQIRDMVAARMTPVSGSPVGNVEALSVAGDKLDVVGWAYDPDVPTASIDVGVSVDGGWALSLRANGNRPDVGAAYPGIGNAHGFRGQLALSPGRHTVCVVFVNAGSAGANTWMKCQGFTATDIRKTYNPVGNVEAAVVEGRTLRASGWSVDPDSLASSLDMHVYVNGQFGQSIVANAPRADVGAAFPGAGPAHGWSWQTTVNAPGTYRVCVYAINRADGTENPLLNCVSLVVTNTPFQPVGHLDAARANGRALEVEGWALDPDALSSALPVHVYVDGRYARPLTADTSRADIAAAFAGAGDRHGFGSSIEYGPGVHTVCAYAINAGAGSVNPGLGCATAEITQRAWEPIGNLEAVTPRGGGRVDLTGWAWDPDAGPSSSPVHLYVDGRYAGQVQAAGNRPDVAAAFPGAGPGHGFSASLLVGAGAHTVCAFGINAGMGQSNPVLACRSVTA
ncbi:N-acetylmuramoyl-L-alanine amidase [Blastococcus sp. CT_GayMR16]|uniref:N-acetylmuramoyl-L-alanine amidase n=1 Tax=Blastococcus sp. CT_GayMR16 TaxID=2559607 RepID=UPI00107441ED|nr:N-acetylmuramoyl-L-alanine amidase [Blastococcus sp. CT_GayMR16]TFV87777.1 hypothetical protein E4P38_12430 [Blastococcus sp. CT_GayMR16]